MSSKDKKLVELSDRVYRGIALSRTYHIWTLGCQMNVADSQRLASELEKMGYRTAQNPDDADVLVVNTCVVRQGAEDKGVGPLVSLRPLKEKYPVYLIGFIVCMVAVPASLPLRQPFHLFLFFLP